MKKFFSSLLVLIILAALVLFFGWAQRGVPPDAYGIIRSKTHGLDTRVIKAGEFRWLWYKIIPTNAVTSVFRLNPVNYEFSAYNTLPSGRDYASFAGIGETFSWEIRAAFSFSLRPESLIVLVEENNIGTQEDLDRYGNNLAGQIDAYIIRRISTDPTFYRQIEELLENGENVELEQEIERQFPAITRFTLKVKSAQFPDFALYQQVKGLYEGYIAIQKEFLSGELQKKKKNRVEAYHRFEELEQYGALLTKYPILLDYLALENHER
jgi:hypothetical protein